jgi:hypothetical protein
MLCHRFEPLLQPVGCLPRRSVRAISVRLASPANSPGTSNTGWFARGGVGMPSDEPRRGRGSVKVRTAKRPASIATLPSRSIAITGGQSNPSGRRKRPSAVLT